MNSNLRRAHGPTVRALRIARRATIDTIADAANISRGYLSKVERGIRNPEPDVTARLAVALDVPVDILTGQRPALPALRDLLGIAADALAADVGLIPAQLDRIERGLTTPSADVLTRIAVRLGVEPAALQAHQLAVAGAGTP